MPQQFAYVLLQLLCPYFYELFALQVKRCPNTFLGQFRNYASSEILYQLVLEILEITKPTRNESLHVSGRRFFAFNFIKFITFNDAIIDQHRSFYLDNSIG
jgi:hypothetical protein